MTRINAAISDLFFNTEKDHAESGDWDATDESARADLRDMYDMGELHEVARNVLGCLGALGVPNLPTADELIDDFFERL